VLLPTDQKRRETALSFLRSDALPIQSARHWHGKMRTKSLREVRHKRIKKKKEASASARGHDAHWENRQRQQKDALLRDAMNDG
jgi:hypothetical protein